MMTPSRAVEIDLIHKGIKTGSGTPVVYKVNLDVEIDLIHKGIKTRTPRTVMMTPSRASRVEIDLIHKGIKTGIRDPRC